MFIEREDILQQIELLRLTKPHQYYTQYDYLNAKQSLGWHKVAYTREFNHDDFSTIPDTEGTRLDHLLTLSYRFYRIKDERLKRIAYRFFFLGLSQVEIGELEGLDHSRICHLLHEAIALVE